jgi:Ca-activated chloride channel family protein
MNADDPKFTAYALDELEPAERAAVEAELRAHPALAAELEELRSFTAQLRGELQAEEGAPLAPEQRAAVLGQVPRIVAGPRAWWLRPWLQSAAAACVIVGLIAAHFARIEVKRPQVALGEAREQSVKLRLEPEAELPQLQTEYFFDAGQAMAEAKPATTPLSANDHLDLGRVLTGPQAQSAGATGGTKLPYWLAFSGYEEAPHDVAGYAAGSSRFTIAGPKAPQSDLSKTLSVIEPSREEDSYQKIYRTQSGKETEVLAAGVTGGSGSLTTAGRQLATAPTTLEKGRGFRTLAGQSPGPTAKLSESSVSQRLAGKPAQVYAVDSDALLGRAKTKWNYQNEADKNIGFVRAPEKTVAEGLDALADGIAVVTEPDPQGNTEAYDVITDNAFCATKDQPLSTFAVDVDTASYANVRRILNANERPPKGAVRIEELVNYFRYDYPQPDGADAFSCKTEVATCPWQTEHRLACVGIKGRELKRESRPVANLVFLIDVSGSMQPENKLPLVKQSLGLLIDQLGAEDTVAIAVYAGASGCVLEPTHDREKMRGALDRLQAGGSTNGAAGIQLAYDLVQRSFKKGGTNRVILCTDGDFNVGITNQSELVSMIQGKAKTGIFLSVFGFGMGNLKDSTLEKLADKGNGNYDYIDTLAEGRKVFVEQMTGTLFTIAKDVKIQVEFNPAQVAAYRLIGYENRLLAKEDFNDDKKDAGEIGAGHTVTALYEVVPAGKEIPDAPVVDDLKYQKATKLGAVLAEVAPSSKELLTVKVRYKQPDADVSKKLEFPLTDSGATWEKSSRDFRWAASVASFGLLLRDSPHKGTANWNMTLELATEGKGDDRDGYRSEFVGLVEKAKALSR